LEDRATANRIGVYPRVCGPGDRRADVATRDDARDVVTSDILSFEYEIDDIAAGADSGLLGEPQSRVDEVAADRDSNRRRIAGMDRGAGMIKALHGVDRRRQRHGQPEWPSGEQAQRPPRRREVERRKDPGQ